MSFKGCKLFVLVLSKLQSNAAPCQPFDLILKEFGIEKGAFGKYDPLPPAPPPELFSYSKMYAKNHAKTSHNGAKFDAKLVQGPQELC